MRFIRNTTVLPTSFEVNRPITSWGDGFSNYQFLGNGIFNYCFTCPKCYAHLKFERLTQAIIRKQFTCFCGENLVLKGVFN